MQDLKALHIMMHPVVFAARSISAREIGQKLLAGPYSGVPVVDEHQRIIGMVTEFDLLKAVQKGKDLAKMTVADIMSTGVITADIDTPAGELMKLMVDKKVRRIPITEQGRLVGVVSRYDFLKGLFKPEFAPYWSEWGQD